MAVTVNRYNHTAKLFMNKEVTFTTIKAMLLDSTAVAAFNAAHTDVDDVAGAESEGHRPNEVYGNGWTEGGKLLTTVAVAVRSTNGMALTADDVSVTATGGSIGPARGVLLYDSTSDKPLWLYNFGQDETAGEETDMLLAFDPTGTRGTILTIT